MKVIGEVIEDRNTGLEEEHDDLALQAHRIDQSVRLFLASEFELAKSWCTSGRRPIASP